MSHQTMSHSNRAQEYLPIIIKYTVCVPKISSSKTVYEVLLVLKLILFLHFCTCI